MKLMRLTKITLPFFMAITAGCSILPEKTNQNAPEKDNAHTLSENEKAFLYIQTKRRSDHLERLMDRLSIQSYQMYRFMGQMDEDDCENFESSEFTESTEKLRQAFEKSTSDEIELGRETTEGRMKRLKEFYDAYFVAIGNFKAISESCEYK